ncbi:UNVERIFIED_CONTAM: hypothetical protein K2H54_060399 [Gekko kuhli]
MKCTLQDSIKYIYITVKESQERASDPSLLVPRLEVWLPPDLPQNQRETKVKAASFVSDSGQLRAGMAEAFHQDLTCSVCLELFTEPVLLACGHCFCQACITSSWQSQAGAASCPDCRAPCPDRRYTPSRLLRSLAQRARQAQQEVEDSGGAGREAGEGEEEDGRRCCEAHGDSLGLFCLTDEAPVCYRCVDSPAHAGHSFSSLQDGARKCKEKLAQWLESLEARVETLEGRERCQEGHMASLRDSAASLHVNIEARFSELQQFLNQRKDAILAQLEKEETDAHNDMETRLCQIQEGLNYAMDLRSQGRVLMERENPAVFLLDIQPFLHTMTEGNEDNKDSFAVLCKELRLGRFKGPIQHLACAALCSAFELGFEPVQLDPNTSHPVFIISQNGMYVETESKLLKCCNNPERFQNHPIVLGKSSFCSGEHYWEIETKDAADWAIGVATESIERKVRVPTQGIVDKVWALRLATAGPEGETFSQRFGVYLDYDKAPVSGEGTFASGMTKIPIKDDSFCLLNRKTEEASVLRQFNLLQNETD